MEKRKHARKSYGAPVVYESPAMPYHGKIANLSAGGILIETGVPVAPGVELTVSFDLSGRKINAKGKVIRFGSRSLGVEFLPHEKAMLTGLIDTIH